MLDDHADTNTTATPTTTTTAGTSQGKAPRREDAVQGALGDAWLIAALGAVAGHRPEAIRRALQRHPSEGTRAELHETRPDPMTADWIPTGQGVRLELSDELTPLPYAGQQHHLYANTIHTATVWPALLEKAFAAIDTTWSRTRRITIPTRGYPRLDQPAGLFEIAEALTQLTGTRAGVVHLANDTAELTLRYLLAHHRPVIITTPVPVNAEARTWYGLYPGHTYEITRVGQQVVDLHNPWGALHLIDLPLDQLLSVTGGPIATLKD